MSADPAVIHGISQSLEPTRSAGHMLDRRDGAVRMPGEALLTIARMLVAEFIHRRERIGERGI